MTITELQELTDHHFDFIIPAADGQILFAGPLPDEYGKELPHIPTDGSSLNLDEAGLYAWEDAWARYIDSLTPKRRNRTRKQAEEQGATKIAESPKEIALITAKDYQFAMTPVATQKAHLQPLIPSFAEALQQNYDALMAAGEIEDTQFFRYYDKDPQAVSNMDLTTLRVIFSIFHDNVQKMAKNTNELMEKVASPGFKNQTITIYVPNFLKMIGLSPNHNKSNEETVLNKIDSYVHLYGVLIEKVDGKEYKGHYPVLRSMGYDERTNNVEVASPYFCKLIQQILESSIKKNSHGKPKLKRDGQPELDPAYSFLVPMEIAKERNKRALEIVYAVVVLIEQRGNYDPATEPPPHIMIGTIVERCVGLQNALNAAKTSSDKSKLLRRAFPKAWQLLETKTKLRERYKNIKFPTLIPAYGDMNKTVEFPHEGKIKQP